MQLALRASGVGFLPPLDGGGGGGDGLFSSLFDIFGSVAEATPQYLPAITAAYDQNDPTRQSQQQPYTTTPRYLLPASQPVAAASDNSWLWLAIAFLAGAVIFKR